LQNFRFRQKNNLEKDETLSLFGSYYFDEVLKNPDRNDHQNIRNFITLGWNGISFQGEALELKY